MSKHIGRSGKKYYGFPVSSTVRTSPLAYTVSITGQSSHSGPEKTVMASRQDSSTAWQVALVAVACGLFLLLGALLVPRAGIQNDEALFSSPLFNTLGETPFRRLLHFDIPLMVMSYLGSLKSLLYIPILRLFGSSVWTLRLPMVDRKSTRLNSSHT